MTNLKDIIQNSLQDKLRPPCTVHTSQDGTNTIIDGVYWKITITYPTPTTIKVKNHRGPAGQQDSPTLEIDDPKSIDMLTTILAPYLTKPIA